MGRFSSSGSLLGWKAKLQSTDMRAPTLYIMVAMLVAGACNSSKPVIEVTAPAPKVQEITHWPGVDSSIALAANSLADSILVPPERLAEGQMRARKAKALAYLADSLLGPIGIFALPEGPDTTSVEQRNNAIEAFNDGVTALNAYGEASDSLNAVLLLADAVTAFRAALNANPFDEESHYWLSRVYQLQADALGSTGAIEEAIDVLRRLVSMHNHQHVYLSLLAEMHERRRSKDGGLAAAVLWERAAQELITDASIDDVWIDSLTVFTYFARSSRAFILASEGELALTALDYAAPFSVTSEGEDFLESERQWIAWDDADVETRIRFDSLLTVAATRPENAVDDLIQLANVVRSRRAQTDVQHELALLQYQIGEVEAAVSRIAALWSTLQDSAGVLTPKAIRVREDYGVIAFNIGLTKKDEGNMRAALGYFMQSEATRFSQAGKAAFEVSRLLKNDIPAALAAAQRAENVIDQLNPDEQDELLRHIIELLRRSGNRGRAQEYIQKLRQLR